MHLSLTTGTASQALALSSRHTGLSRLLLRALKMSGKHFSSSLKKEKKAASGAQSRWKTPTKRPRSEDNAGPAPKKERRPILDLYLEHRAENPDVPSFCGTFYHTNRLVRTGTNLIFNKYYELFKGRCNDRNQMDWEGVKDLLFTFKHDMHEKYRNMMFHFAKERCEGCLYWDGFMRHYITVRNEVEKMEVDNPNYVPDCEMLQIAEAADSLMDVSD